MKTTQKIGYGLCCISLALQENGVAYKRQTYANFKKTGNFNSAIKSLSALCLKNAITLQKIEEYCIERGFARYRIPSDIFPLLKHPSINIELCNLPDFDEIKSVLKSAGSLAKKGKLRLSFHPSQFDVIASKRDEVSRNAAADINLCAEILDMLGTSATHDSPINIHLGRNPDSTPEEFESDFLRGIALLSPSAQKRLVLENEDKGFWNVKNLYAFLKKMSGKNFYGKMIPLTLDFHHNKVNPCGLSDEAAFKLAYPTWRNATPVFHYSESATNTRPAAHSEFLKSTPPYFGKPYFCMIEAKRKDYAIVKLLALGDVK